MTLAEPSYQSEFPDFVLDVAIPDGFKDVSWRNDACPTWLNEDLQVFLYVDFANPSDREFPEIERFGLKTAVDGCVTDDEPILFSNDWAAITAKLDQLTADMAPKPA